MMKKFLVILMTFLTLFLTQSKVFAAVKNSDTFKESIIIDKQVFSLNLPNNLISEKISMNNNNSMLWTTSIFITGLGQILMGETFVGLSFLLSQALLVTLSILTISSNSGVGSIGFSGWASSVFVTPVILIILGVLIIYLHIWNITDSYNRSQEIIKNNKLDTNNLKKIEEKFTSIVELTKKIRVYNNGDISVNLFAF